MLTALRARALSNGLEYGRQVRICVQLDLAVAARAACIPLYDRHAEGVGPMLRRMAVRAGGVLDNRRA